MDVTNAVDDEDPSDDADALALRLKVLEDAVDMIEADVREDIMVAVDPGVDDVVVLSPELWEVDVGVLELELCTVEEVVL